MASPDAGRGGFGVAVYGGKEVGLDSQADQILTALRKKINRCVFFIQKREKTAQIRENESV
jgi:hypothetical protein